jgi:hypothetical protein
MDDMAVYHFPIQAGIGFGTALAITISYTYNRSILWAILHGILGWLYVIWAALFHEKR